MAHEKRIVIAFGRFNPPQTGHEAIVTFLTQTAHRMGAEARIYPSPTTDAKKNPLPFREKVGFLRQLFPHVTINDNPAMNTPFAAFADASGAGYKDITVIVGADRVRDFESFAAYLLPASSSKYNAAKHIDVSHYRVLAIPRGIGAMSATLMRGYVVANDFPSFLAGTPGKNVAVAKKLFASLRQHMHIREQQDYRNAMRQKVQEAEVASSLKMLNRLLDEGKDYSMVVVDPDGGSPSWKQGGHGHTPVPKVVWQMHSLDASDLKHAVELAHKAHPKLNVSIENKSGRVIRVVKPGQKFTEAAPIKEARMPLKGHPYHKKTDAELRYIIKDAGEAAKNMQGHNRQAEDKYADQVNDAQTVLYYRKNGGLKEASTTRMTEDHVKVGDAVHAGLATLGGHGFKGTVDKIDGNWVYVNIGKDKYGDRIIKALMRTVTVMKEAVHGLTASDQLRGARIIYKALVGQEAPRGMMNVIDIINTAIPALRKGTHTPEKWAIAGHMLMKAKHDLGINWDITLISPSTRRAMGMTEDAPMSAPKPPSDVDRLKVRQATDTITLKQRQATELMAAKVRDVETKAREAQTKATAPKSAAVSAS